MTDDKKNCYLDLQFKRQAIGNTISIQICFEIIDPLTIEKIVTNKAAYYVKISALPGWTKPELNETIPGFTIWIDEAQALRKYEFLCAKSEKYVPYTEFVMQDVR